MQKEYLIVSKTFLKLFKLRNQYLWIFDVREKILKERIREFFWFRVVNLKNNFEKLFKIQLKFLGVKGWIKPTERIF